MNGIAIAALAAALSLLPGAGEDLATLRGDAGDWELQAPTGWTERTPKKSNVEREFEYPSGKPYQRALIKVRKLAGIYTKPEHLENFVKYLEKDIGGNITYEGDSKNRFSSDIQSGGTWWISLVEARLEPPNAIAIEILLQKDIFDATKDTWIAVCDSLKTFPPPKDPYEIPTGWKINKTAMFAVLGPMLDQKEKKAKDFLETRMAKVAVLLDIDTTATRIYRQVFNDERKVFPRCPVHVHPTAEGFKAAAGDRWVEGETVIWLADHPERVLLVNASADGGFRDEDLLAGAGVAYAGSRLGKMPPWLQAALHHYYAGAIKRNTPGLFPPEMLKKGKEVFAKTPAAFDDLVKMDQAAFSALGEDGRVAAWGLFQCGLHGPDAGVRNLFRGFLHGGIDAPDLAPVWEKCVAKYKEETKKVFKGKDLDAAAKKYFRDMKEEKR